MLFLFMFGVHLALQGKLCGLTDLKLVSTRPPR